MSILIFIGGFRDGLGVDYNTYKYIYNNLDYAITMEKGYYVLNYFFNKLGFPVYIIFLISISITLIFVFHTISKYSKIWFVSFFIFFTNPGLYFENFSGVRQFIAISIFFFSIKYIIERNIFKYFFMIFIGVLFHKSILFMIPFYFLLNINYSKIQIITLILLSVILNKLDIIMVIFDLTKSLLPDRYLVYANYAVNSEVVFNSGLTFIINLGIFILIVLNKDKFKTNEIFLRAYMYYFVIFSIFQKYFVFSRVSWYFEIFSIIVIPNVIFEFNKKNRKLLVIGIIFYYFLIFTKALYIGGEEPMKIIPYKNILW